MDIAKYFKANVCSLSFLIFEDFFLEMVCKVSH